MSLKPTHAEWRVARGVPSGMPYADPDKAREYHREYKRANRWRYQRRQKVYDAAKHANQRAVKFGRPGVLTPEDVERLLTAEECYHCKAQVSFFKLEVDHLVPLADPASTNTPDNVVASCEPCNCRKAAKPSASRWSRHHDCCVLCGLTERPHSGKGKCARCWHRGYRRPPRRNSKRKSSS